MTRVKIASDCDGRATVETVDGSSLPMVESITLRLKTNEINRADLTIACVDLTAEAEARFLIPFDGTLREVKRIEFADGTTWEVNNAS